jgi:hypothetical protein
MNYAERIIEIAVKEVGTKESPANSNRVKYNEWIYNKVVEGPQYPWCAAFVSWVYDQAGINLGRIDVMKGFVGCPYAVNNVAKWGRIVTVPTKGCVVFFDWEGDGKFDHTGIFNVDLGGGKFEAIEGNTSVPRSADPKEAKQANSNGGEVLRRSDRKYKNCVFVLPKVLEKTQVPSL